MDLLHPSPSSPPIPSLLLIVVVLLNFSWCTKSTIIEREMMILLKRFKPLPWSSKWVFRKLLVLVSWLYLVSLNCQQRRIFVLRNGATFSNLLPFGAFFRAAINAFKCKWQHRFRFILNSAVLFLPFVKSSNLPQKNLSNPSGAITIFGLFLWTLLQMFLSININLDTMKWRAFSH